MEEADVAAGILSLLGDRGPVPIADVLTGVRGELTRLLHALRDLQQFHLVEYDADTRRIALTASGAETATAVKGNDIRVAASKLLGAAGE